MLKKTLLGIATVLVACVFAFWGAEPASAQTYTGRWAPEAISNGGYVNIKPVIDVSIDYTPGSNTMTASFREVSTDVGWHPTNGNGRFWDGFALALPPCPSDYTRSLSGVYPENVGTRGRDNASHDLNTWCAGRGVYWAAQSNSNKVTDYVKGGALSDGQWHTYTYDLSGYSAGQSPVLLYYGNRLYPGSTTSRVEMVDYLTTGAFGMNIKIAPRFIINKTSNDPSLSITDRYSLQGAQYTLYTNQACTSVARDDSGNAVVFTTNAQGRVDASRVIGTGTYWLKETKAPTGYRLDATPHRIDIAGGGTYTLNLSDAPQRGTLSISKTSGAPSWTKGNSCYALENATYEVYRGGVKVATLTTKTKSSDGIACNSETITLPLGAYTIKEITPSKGYRLDPNTYTVDISTDNQSEVVKSTEYPLMDVSPLKLHKVDADVLASGHADTSQGGLTLAGAKYSVKYYDGYYTSVLQTAPLSPKWERIYVTAIDANGEATFTVPDSDKFSDGDSQLGWPLGTYVVEEIEPAFGYYADEASPYITQITQASATTGENRVISGACDIGGDTLISDTNALRSVEKLKRADLMIMKYGEPSVNEDDNPDLKEPQAGVQFEIINDNECDVWRVDAKTWAKPGDIVYTITTDEQGYASTRDFALDNGEDHALPCGRYTVHEVEESVHDGYAHMEDKELVITTPLKTYRWTVENKIGTALDINKVDVDTGNIIRGHTSFSIYKEDGSLVEMNVQYPAGETISVFTTDIKGSVILPEKLMPGKYSIKEVKAPDGYTLNTAPLDFVVDGSTVNTWENPLVLKFKDEPVMGVITVSNYDVETEGKITESASHIKVIAAEDIITADGTTRAHAGDVVYEADTKNGELTTPPLHLGKYKVVQETAPDGYVRNTEEYDAELVFENDRTPMVSDSVSISNIPQKAHVSIEVRDKESNKPILVPGAAYEMRAREDVVGGDGKVHIAAGTVVEIITTDENGHATTNNEYRIGKYEFVETLAPNGYVIDRTPVPADIVYAGQASDSANCATAIATNVPQKGNVTVVKKDKETNGTVQVAGAEFVIVATEDIVTGDGTLHHHAGDIVVDSIATDSSGIAHTNAPLYLGAYEVKELKAPVGYMRSDETAPIVLQYAGQENSLVSDEQSTISFSDDNAKGSVQITKRDSGNGNALLAEGVEIDIVAAEDIVLGDGVTRASARDVIATIVTDEHGTAIGEGLWLGKYNAVEKTAPEGYKVNPVPVPFEITYNGDIDDPEQVVTEIRDDAIMGIIEIQKVDSESEKVLAHSEATFEVIAKDDIATMDGTVRAHKGEVVDEIVTEQGIGTSKELFPGVYTIKEKAAPEHYLLNADEYDVEVISEYGEDGLSHVSQQVKDDVQKASVTIDKTDKETDKPIINPQNEFDIVADEDIVTPEGTIKHHKGDIVETVTANDDGIIKTSDLYIGKYSIVEKAPHSGYMLNDEPLSIELEYDENVEGNVEETARHYGIMPRGALDIDKVSAFDHVTALEGAEFSLRAKGDVTSGCGTVWHKDGEEVDRGITDENGKLTFEGLRQGTYVLTETNAPEGYRIAEDREITVSYEYVPEESANDEGADSEAEAPSDKEIDAMTSANENTKADIALNEDDAVIDGDNAVDEGNVGEDADISDDDTNEEREDSASKEDEKVAEEDEVPTMVFLHEVVEDFPAEVNDEIIDLPAPLAILATGDTMLILLVPVIAATSVVTLMLVRRRKNR